MGDFFSFIADHWILSGLWVALFTVIVMNELKGRVLGFKDLTPAQAVDLINKEDAVVLDVRDDNEFKQGHIINAVNVPVALIDSRLDELEAHKDRPLIVACRTGQRAARAGSVLNKQGFSKLYKLGGGMLAWQSANLPTTK